MNEGSAHTLPWWSEQRLLTRGAADGNDAPARRSTGHHAASASSHPSVPQSHPRCGAGREIHCISVANDSLTCKWGLARQTVFSAPLCLCWETKDLAFWCALPNKSNRWFECWMSWIQGYETEVCSIMKTAWDVSLAGPSFPPSQWAADRVVTYPHIGQTLFSW